MKSYKKHIGSIIMWLSSILIIGLFLSYAYILFTADSARVFANPVTFFCMFILTTLNGVSLSIGWKIRSNACKFIPSKTTKIDNVPLDKIGRIKPVSFKTSHIITRNHRFKINLILTCLYAMFFSINTIGLAVKHEYILTAFTLFLTCAMAIAAKSEMKFHRGPKFFELSDDGIWIDAYNYYVPWAFFAHLAAEITARQTTKTPINFYTLSLRIKIPFNQKEYYQKNGIYTPAAPESKNHAFYFFSIPLIPATESKSLSASYEEITELFRHFQERNNVAR